MAGGGAGVITAPADPCTKWSLLARLLPAEQREQLAAIILARLAAGWGSVEIEFKDGHVERFREITSIPATRPNGKQLTP
jgi:hypothetical protein